MSKTPAWHDAYPKPRNPLPNVVKRDDLLQWLKDGQKSGVDFLLVDLRRTDHEVTIAAKQNYDTVADTTM